MIGKQLDALFAPTDALRGPIPDLVDAITTSAAPRRRQP
jgi:hypothetical protein